MAKSARSSKRKIVRRKIRRTKRGASKKKVRIPARKPSASRGASKQIQPSAKKGKPETQKKGDLSEKSKSQRKSLQDPEVRELETQTKVGKEAGVGDEITLDKTPMRIYLQQIENIPLLTPEEELDLAQKIYHKGAQAKQARSQMIRQNLRLVISIAKRYANIGLPFSDLVEEGNIGLMRAVDKFNYKKGYRLSTYASWWIKQAIMRALSNQGKTIRVPVYLYDIISKYRKVKDGLTQKLGRAPTRKEISDAMELPIRKVKEVERIASQPSSLNAPISLDGSAELIDIVQDENATHATENIQEAFTSQRIEGLLGLVDEREREILALRFGLHGEEPKTLEETAKQFNITRERVRQIEVVALKKIRDHLSAKNEHLGDYLTRA